MGNIGYRDGDFNVKTLKLEQKRLKYDIYPYYASTHSTRICSAYGWLNSTAATTFQSTTFSVPRNVAFHNNMGADAERQMKVSVKGYTAQGEFREEIFTLATATDGSTIGSVAWAYISSVVPATATKGYGTYGSVALRLGNKVGLTEYCEDVTDILNVMIGTSKSMIGSAYMVSSATLFNKTNQTLDVTNSRTAVVGSTIGIVYRSKFQKRVKN